MSYTPGPWRIVRIDRELVGSIYRGKTRICTGILDYMKPQEEAEGNAALIAAAPEMLEVLERIRDESGPFNSREMQKLAEAAIRKARGEE